LPQKIIKPLDSVIIAIVAILAITAAIPILAAGRYLESSTASVLYDGGIIEISLSNDRVIEIESGGYTLEVTILDGAVFVSKADCPDRFCISHGKITRSGQAIICLPARVLIEIKGGDNNAYNAEYDAIAG
jgi:hypothetical protein